MTMIHIHNGVFFQPNLTNKGFKESEEDRLLNRLIGTGHTILWKNDNMIIIKRYPKFGMATYTKEIVTIK